jgi:signal transduction histidine kinase
VTELRDPDRRLAALVHEPASLDDPKLAESVLAAVRIAVSNIALQREIQRRIGELDASRRRLVEAADLQRRQLAQRVRGGAASRLEHVDEILTGAEKEGADPAVLAGVLAELGAAGTELGEFAQGLRPRLLAEQGLAAALTDLVQRGVVPVELRVVQTRSRPAIEAAAYFVCAEALANIGKHAPSARATIEVTQVDARLIVTVGDDGDGGASFGGGSGLRGLADRVEALGGRFTVTSPPGEGTTVTAELPARRV